MHDLVVEHDQRKPAAKRVATEDSPAVLVLSGEIDGDAQRQDELLADHRHQHQHHQQIAEEAQRAAENRRRPAYLRLRRVSFRKPSTAVVPTLS
jgi:type VI protein secretion system component Hcp